MSLTYGTTPIPQGSLPVGDVFAVLTNGGNYSKVAILGYQNTLNIDVNIQWVTQSPAAVSTPEPSSVSLIALGLALVGFPALRRLPVKESSFQRPHSLR